MSELRDLYQEVILDHSKNPKNYRCIDHPDHVAEGYNPLCGDRITLFIKMEDGKIVDIGFQGSGCAISKASASMMTSALKGKTAAEADAIFRQFHNMLTSAPGDVVDPADLGKLKVFSGVREFPVRVKCASLAWHTMRSALKGDPDQVSTE